MKPYSKIIANTLACAVLATTLGCATGHQVRSARPLQTVDPFPQASAKGYVEFSSSSKDAVVLLYLLDSQHKPCLLAGTGTSSGARYSFQRYQTNVAEKVRIALPPGQHQFVIQTDGDVVQVPVEEGKETRVELNYVVLQDGDLFTTYRLTCRLSEPAPLSGPRGG